MTNRDVYRPLAFSLASWISRNTKFHRENYTVANDRRTRSGFPCGMVRMDVEMQEIGTIEYSRLSFPGRRN